MNITEKIDPTEGHLWGYEDCAQYMGVARWTFVNRISKEPDFPRPAIELSRKIRRWLPEDVKDWAYRCRRRNRR